MASTSAAGTNRLIVVAMALWMLMPPWLGFWQSDHSLAAVGYSAGHMALMPFVCAAIFGVEQLVIYGAARLFGDRMPATVIGIGPQVFERTGAFHHLSIRVVPMVSVGVIVSPRRNWQRLRIAGARLIGVAAMTVVLVVIYRSASSPTWAALKQSLATHIAIDTLLIFAIGYLIFIGGISALIVDGVDETQLQTRRNLAFVLAAQRHLHDGAFDVAIATVRRGLEECPDDPLLLLSLGGALSTRSDDGFEIAESLTKRELSGYLRAAALNLWAWQCYVRGIEDLRAEADRASREALELAPRDPSFLDTRGHVLLWTGRTAQAEEHLKRAYSLARSRSTRASAAAGLALICSRDRHDEALTWLDHSRREDMHHRLVSKASAAVEPLRRM